MKIKITVTMLFLVSIAFNTAPISADSGHLGPLVLIDEGHSEWLVSGRCEYLIQNLEDRGYLVQTLTGTVTPSSLEDCDVLIIGTAWGSFTQAELQAIEEYVKNGGGLLLTGVGWSWVDYHPESTLYDYPMNQIAQRFSGFFNPDIIFDPTDYTIDPGSPIFHKPFISSHPITVGVSEVACGVFGEGLGGLPGSISLTTGIALITGDDDSYGGYHESPYPNPGTYPPFLVAIEYFLGRVVLVGHEGTFIDEAIHEYDNKILGLNIINWLSIPPTVETTDETGERRNVFDIPETVYVRGSGYSPTTIYDLYLVEDTMWSGGMDIPDRVSGTETSVTTDEKGDIPEGTVAWNRPLTPGKYDIVIDVNGNGKYDEEIDALDDEDIEVTAGLYVIPEYMIGTILALMGCLAALAVFRLSKGKRVENLHLKH